MHIPVVTLVHTNLLCYQSAEEIDTAELSAVYPLNHDNNSVPSLSVPACFLSTISVLISLKSYLSWVW